MFGLAALMGCTKKDTDIIQPAGEGGSSEGQFKVSGAVSKSSTEVEVTFTAPAGAGAGDPANYTISEANGGVAYVMIQRALVLDGGTRVALTTLAQSDLRYVLAVANVTDSQGRPIDPAGATANLLGTPAGGASPDSDGDGLSDAVEQRGWDITVFEANTQVLVRQVTSRPDLSDTDGDGMSDEEERRRGTDPREEDTDRDGLTDPSETRFHFSIPYRQDSDSDGIADGDEVNRNRTSPLLSDTDGDTISDFAEIFERASHPLIADVPEARIVFAGDLDLRLNIEYTDGSTITTQDGTKLSRAETTSASFTDSTVNTESYEFGEKVSAGAEAGKEPKSTMGGEVSAAQKFVFEETVTWNETSSQEVREESERIRTFARARTETAASGTISMGLRVQNTGETAFTLRNLVVSVLLRDPQNRRAFKTLATLNLNETLLGNGITLGPFNGETGVLQIANATANAALVKDLLANPSGIVLEVGTFDLLDAEGRNFAFLSEVTNARTALITVDYGDGRVERYRVATGVARNPDGTARGITMRDALTGVVGLDYQTEPGEVEVGEQTVVEQRLVRVRDVSSDLPARKVWAILASREALVAPGLDFDDILLKGGDSIFLAYITDQDGDRLSAREEFLYRTKDSESDTDGDGLTDFEEVKVGWQVARDEVETVFSDPLSADADRDGLTDIRERNLTSGPTDPLDPDSDGDGLCDGPGTPDAPADFVCRRSNRDPNPLEPRLTTAPRLVGLTPEPEQVDAPPAAPIEAFFDQTMDPASHFAVHGLMSGLKQGSFGHGSVRSVLRFTPDVPFLAGEPVSVRLTGSVRNVDQIPLLPLVFRHRTAVTDTESGGYLDAPPAVVAWEHGFGILPLVDLITADFNGDGLPDLALADAPADAVNVLMNAGAGRLALPARYGQGATPVALAAADLDGDGDADMAVATRNAGAVRVLLNTGNGVFAPFGTFTIGSSATAIAAADFNGDGRPDLAVTDETENNLLVLYNLGDRTFGAPEEIDDLNSPNDVAAADLTGDGRPDLVVTGETDARGHVFILITDATGIPGLAETHDIVEGAAHAVALADLTGDSLSDIAVTVDTFKIEVGEGGYVATLENSSVSPGVFMTPVVQLLPRVGGSTGSTDNNDRTRWGLTAADFNGDGKVDLAVSNEGNSAPQQAVRFLPGLGDGLLGAPIDIASIPAPGHLVAADLDQNGRPDLAFVAEENEGGGSGFSNGTVNVLLNRGAGGAFGFARPPLFPAFASVSLVVPADLDGDGDVDVAVLGALGGDLVIHLNDGTGALVVDSTTDIPGTGLAGGWMVAADLNGNGLPDLAVGTAFAGGGGLARLLVMLNLGNGRFSPPVAYGIGPAGEGQVTAARVAADDLDGDGDTDVAFLARQLPALNRDSLIVTMVNTGSGAFIPGATVSVPRPALPQRLFAGDVAGTGGALDLVVPTGSDVRVFTGDGAGAFAAGPVLQTAAGPREVAVGDLDADLDADLAVALGSPAGGVQVFINEGGTFSTGPHLSPATDGDGVTLADLDGDADLDVVIIQGGDVTVHLNSGAARFGAAQRYLIGANEGAVNVTAADMDRDGDLDLLVPVSGGLAVVKNGAP